jgi:hypothetical protein
VTISEHPSLGQPYTSSLLTIPAIVLSSTDSPVTDSLASSIMKGDARDSAYADAVGISSSAFSFVF